MAATKNKASSVTDKPKRTSRKKSKVEEPTEDIHTTKRTFLYLQLKHIIDVPARGNPMIIKLSHAKNSITKLDEHYTTANEIELSKLDDYNPTFSITIEQDSIEELNTFSDNPLLITLYEGVSLSEFQEEESTEGSKHQETQSDSLSLSTTPEEIPLSQGCLDMLQFFTTKRFTIDVDLILYPILPNRVDGGLPLPTTKTVWQFYILVPLLKELAFSNIVFITLESIYNAPLEISEHFEDLIMDLSFQSKVGQSHNAGDKIKICSYGLFGRAIIKDQKRKYKWESAKSRELNNLNSLALRSGCGFVEADRLFGKLFRSDDAQFDFDGIEIDTEYSLFCNSMHRFVLSKELSVVLEEAVAHNQQHILVELYRRDVPEEILLQGSMDLSLFLYPRVNASRYAVELRANKTPDRKAARPSGGRTSTSRALKHRTAFAIISICLLRPIAEGDDRMVDFNDRQQKEKLGFCTEITRELNLLPVAQMSEETYKAFDEFISTLINHILKNHIQTINDAKEFFCCQLGNFSNIILNLLATDFNRRFPTKTYVEFTQLMTTVYKELVQRVYRILKNSNLEQGYVSHGKTRENIISFMNISKYLYEVGDTELSNFFMEKIYEQNKQNNKLKFYSFIHNAEQQDFASARAYLKSPIAEQWLMVDYFAKWVEIYMNYIDNLKHEETYNEALTNLLTELENFAYKNHLATDAWMLMHCLYKKNNYLPGMSFTRWKYENLYAEPRQPLPPAPRSRWKVYNGYEITFHTEKAIHFYRVVQLFVYLGLYKFAEIVFEEIASECTDVERHLMTTTLKILLNEVEKKTAAKSFAVGKYSNAAELKATLAHVNGHLEYARAANDAAMRSYERILDIEDLLDFEKYDLGLLRLGYRMLEQQEYQQARSAFKKSSMGGNSLVANIGLGKALYGLKRFDEAVNYFAECTKYELHIPDVWAYLALINLKMGHNFQALQCWKYAKRYPDNIIGEQILKELSAINYRDVFLYVDTPL